jgi:hypothetical protein
VSLATFIKANRLSQTQAYSLARLRAMKTPQSIVLTAPGFASSMAAIT